MGETSCEGERRDNFTFNITLLLFYYLLIIALLSIQTIINHRLTFAPSVFIKGQKNTKRHNETSVKLRNEENM